MGRLVPIKDHPRYFRRWPCWRRWAAPHLWWSATGRARGLEGLPFVSDSTPGSTSWDGATDLETILGELDVVICASRNEGTPVALIEAMAAGISVLSTDVGGVADLVAHGKTGWLVPPGDPPALARAIEELLGDPALRARLAAPGPPWPVTTR